MLPGLVVEDVAASQEGLRAGLLKGDILLAWSRGETKGALESPFDLSEVEVEQAPRGTVILEGSRGAEKRTWMLGPDVWGIRARPNFEGLLLKLYEQGKELVNAGNLSDATARWQAAASEVDSSIPEWLRAWFLVRAADALAAGQRWQEADDAYRAAVEHASSAGPFVESQLLKNWAQKYQQRNDWANAEKYYQRSLSEIQKLPGAELATASVLGALGGIAWRRGDLGKMEEYNRQALSIQERLAPGSLAVAASLHRLGLVAWSRGDLDKAEEYYRQALNIKERLAPGSLDVAASLNNLGNVAMERGDLAKAEAYQRQSLSIKEKLAPGSLDVAASLGNLGIIAYERGDLAKAEEYHHQALNIKDKLVPGSLDVAATLNNLGNVVHTRGDLAEGEEYYRRALKIKEKLAPGSLDVARSLHNLGMVAYERGDLAKAERYYRHELNIKEKQAPASLELARCLAGLGTVALARRDLAKAEEYYRQALNIKERLAPGTLSLADILGSFGRLGEVRGDLAKAEEYYRRSLDIREKLAPGSPDMADDLSSFGRIAEARGDLAAAERYYRQALDILQKVTPATSDEELAKLAGILRRTGRLDQALDLYPQALDILEKEMAMFGGTEETRSDFRAQHVEYYKNYIDALMVQRKSKLAFAVLERSRAQTFLETLHEGHIEIRTGVPPDLLHQERSLRADIQAKSSRRIQMLSDHRGAEQVAVVDKEITGLLGKYQEVKGQMRIASPGYAALTQPQPLGMKEVQRLLDSRTVLLEYDLGKLRSYVFAIGSGSFAVYRLPRRSLIEDQACRLYDLLTTPNKMLQGKSAGQRQNRLTRLEAEYDIAAARLSQTILGPVAAQLKDKRLLIVSDGMLSYVPFAALPIPGTSAVPLVAKHEIVNLPSASVLAALRQNAARRQKASKTVAVLADPVFDAQDIRVEGMQGKAPASPNIEPTASLAQERAVNQTQAGQEANVDSEMKDDENIDDSLTAWDLTRSVADLHPGSKGAVYLPRLQFSRREAASILAVTPAGEGLEALDFAASRTTATSHELEQYRIVHFATHGLLNNRHPELSGLVLSLVDRQGKAQNGFLSLQDIYNMNLRAELVVLSACETSLGKEVEGEGLIGVTRGFMYAGANSVLASLWNINDRATANLMGEFYKAMEQRGMRPAAALRAAQIAMWKQKRWNLPYYWAGFQIQGEWR